MIQEQQANRSEDLKGVLSKAGQGQQRPLPIGAYTKSIIGRVSECEPV